MLGTKTVAVLIVVSGLIGGNSGGGGPLSGKRKSWTGADDAGPFFCWLVPKAE